MQKIRISPDQATKLRSLCKDLFPHLSNVHVKHQNDSTIMFLSTGQFLGEAEQIHWFELCFTHLAKEIAKHYAKAHGSTESYCTYMINQTILSNPKEAIDKLYDIYHNPHKYRVD